MTQHHDRATLSDETPLATVSSCLGDVAPSRTSRRLTETGEAPRSAPPIPYQYIGSELELFAGAVNWKSYLRRQIAPFIGRHVVEVGAGIGATTQALWQDHVQRWVSLEPDPQLARSYAEVQSEGRLSSRCELVVGTTADLDKPHAFDTVLYIDVLEHIEDDRAELCRAANLLRGGGQLVVLAPAHAWLFSAFDRAVGHFRRYTKRSLRALEPPGMQIERLDYLDSLGLLASLANKLLLRQAVPSGRQIAFWDKVLVRGSRIADLAVCHRIGKSVLGVWRRPAEASSGRAN